MNSKKNTKEFILLILSEEQLIPAFKKRLYDYGYRDIEVCSCGSDALDKVKNTRISLVISDVELKGVLNGIETGKRIGDQYDLPLIYLSGLQDENTFQKALATQPLAFLNKPVNWNELRMAIESALFRIREKASMKAVINNITTQKLAEDAMLESEKKFSNLIESADDIIYLLDHDLKYLYANNQCLKRYGLTKEELIGKNYKDFHSGKSLDEFNKKIRAAQKSGKPIIYEHQSKTDGKYFLRTISPIIDIKNKEIDSVTIISRDITKLKKAEEALREREERFRILAQLSPVGIFQTDCMGNTLYVNDRWIEIAEISAEEAEKGKWTDAIYPEDRSGIIEKWQSFIQGESSYRVECRFIQKNRNQIKWIYGEAVPETDNEGNITGFIGIIQDITEAKMAEEKLRASEESYRSLANSITHVFFAMDKDLKYTFWNSTSEKLTGITEKNAIGKHLREFFPDTPQTRKAEQAYKDVLKNREARTFINEFTLGDKDFVFELNVYPTEEGISVLARDITERKKMDEALRESEERFRIASQIATDVVYERDLQTGIATFYGDIDAHLGYESGEYPRTMEGWREHVHPEDLTWIERQSMDQMEPGVPHGIEYRMRKKDGTYVTWWDRIILKRDEKTGKPVKCIGAATNITERKQSEEALRTSQAQLSNAMEIARLGYWEYDVAEDMFTFDDHFYSIFGTSAEKIGGYTMSSARYAELFIHHEDVQVVNTEIRKALETTDPSYSRQLEHRMIYADGSIGYIAVRFVIIKDDQGRTVRTFGVNQDITDRKKVEKALEESETMLRSILRSVSVGIGVVKNRAFEWSNETYQKISGFSENELKGKSTRMVYPDDEEFKKSEHMYEMMKKKGVGFVEAKHKHKNDNIIDVLINIAPIVPGDLNSGVAFTLLDITERKKAEQDIRRNYEEIKKLTQHIETVREEERKMISRDLHDDLGQILTAVKMDLSWIRSRLPVGKTGIKKRAESAIQIIDQAIQVVRKISSELRPVILDDLGLFETLKSHIQDYEDRTKINVIFKFPKVEPEFKPDQEISVFRIIQEVLTNVAKHSGASEVVLQVKEKDNNLGILIRDNGRGIPDYLISSTDSFGLISMRERVLQWGGGIQITGKQGTGTTVKATIPLV